MPRSSRRLLPTLAFLCLLAAAPAQADEAAWSEDYDQALVTAAAEDKAVLLYFTGTDWCT